MSAASPRRLESLIEEAQRVLAICNACRYCDGYCATFPALERRLSFTASDIHYLGSLCHNCGSCLYACQYAPPHEFQVDFPRLMAQVRHASYRRYAWPRFLADVFVRGGLVATLVGIASLALAIVFVMLYAGPARFASAWSDAQGAFYALLPHGPMTGIFGVVFAAAIAALAVGFARFWRDTGEKAGAWLEPHPVASATRDALTLHYLDGGGEGCTYPGPDKSFARRRFHHLTFYGFLLCFAATSVATIYHYVFGWEAPYAFWSVPVVLGTLGGIGLLVGPVGLALLKGRRDPELADPRQDGMDLGFLALLFLTALSGLLLLALRETAAMGAMLAVHLAFVLALFVTMPYGKFVHAAYRVAALMRYHLERRRPLPDTAPE